MLQIYEREAVVAGWGGAGPWWLQLGAAPVDGRGGHCSKVLARSRKPSAEDARAFNPASVSYYTVSLAQRRKFLWGGAGAPQCGQRVPGVEGSGGRGGRRPGAAPHDAAQTRCDRPWRALPHRTRTLLQDQIGSMVPGIVLGSICAVGFILMLVWICVRFCRRRQIAAAEAPPDAQQFLASGGGDPSAGASTGAALEFPHRSECWALGQLGCSHRSL